MATTATQSDRPYLPARSCGFGEATRRLSLRQLPRILTKAHPGS